ncbi:MAG: undecaprenyl-diphosphate phosphatase [Chlamydiota bacterium]
MGSSPIGRPFHTLPIDNRRIFGVSLLEALLLGIIQGITEFFPVSSSGHLELVQHLLGYPNPEKYIFFDLVCHLGTLSAILFFFWRDIITILRYRHSQIVFFIIALIPLFFIYPALHIIESLFNCPLLLGFFFLITAMLLFIGEKFHSNTPPQTLKAKGIDSFLIGLFQCLALLPGVSRSGSTIAIARLRGWKFQDAARFSFLLAIPTILGGSILQIYRLYHNSGLSEASWEQCLIGFLSSAIVGWLALVGLMKIFRTGKFLIFAWYCVLLGLFTIIYFSFT